MGLNPGTPQRTIVGLGELLWDLLPSGPQLGGAPANFAYYAGLLGDEAFVASRVGQDELGQEALQRLEASGLTTAYVQLDATHATSTVPVELDADGVPDFTIIEDVAWDYLEWSPQWQALAARADAVCFGSLCQRSPRSRDTIREFLRATRPDTVRVYDVNLRQSWYSAEVLATSLACSTIVKLNDEELPEVLRTLGLDVAEGAEGARRLLRAFDVALVCVTRGARGSILATASEVLEHPGFKVVVADTIGSGDAFTAALTHNYLVGASLEALSEAANRLGSWVATQVGAMPPVDTRPLREMLEEDGWAGCQPALQRRTVMNEKTIAKQPFGRTGHMSTRTLFGAAALGQVTQAEADRTLEVLLQYGVNHIDTAASYGDAELRIGPWMGRHRQDFFLATKTGERTYREALDELQRSLERLQVDHVDLWQFHGLHDPDEWEVAMGPGGVLEAGLEARAQGLTRFLGVTGHTLAVPALHLRSLERFDFDAVLFPYNYPLMQNPQYAADVEVLLAKCAERNVAVQMIKSICRRPWGERPHTRRTWYEPLEDQPAIDAAVHWLFGRPAVFLNTAGDINVLPKVLDAASRYQAAPADGEMGTLAARQEMAPLWA